MYLAQYPRLPFCVLFYVQLVILWRLCLFQEAKTECLDWSELSIPSTVERHVPTPFIVNFYDYISISRYGLKLIGYNCNKWDSLPKYVVLFYDHEALSLITKLNER